MSNEEFDAPRDSHSLHEVLDFVRRRKLVIIETFVAVLAVGILITWFSRPVYRAMTQVLVQSNKSSLGSLDIDVPFKDLLQSSSGRNIDTQMIILKSKNVLSDACRRANIPQADLDSSVVVVATDDVPDTDVINLSVDSTRPAYAESMSKAVVDAFRHNLQTSRKSAVNGAANYVKGRVEEENQKLENAEFLLRKFKQSKNVVDLTIQKEVGLKGAADLAQSLHEKQADVAAARAILDEIQTTRRHLPATTNTPKTETNTLLIEQLKDRLSLIKNQRAAAVVQYKPTHPIVMGYDKQIEDLQRHIDETPKYITSEVRVPNPEIQLYDDKCTEARGNLAAAVVAEAKLRAQLEVVANKMKPLSALEIQQARLQRDFELRSAAVMDLTKSADNLAIRANADDNPAEVISKPDRIVKVSPSWPRNMVLSILLGAFMSTLVAMLVERLDDRLHTASDATQYLEAPVLGYVPLIENGEARLALSEHRNNNLMETYRLLRSNVQFASVDSPAKSIVVTSAFAGEGKSMTVHNLAVATARTGRRVIVVDADLRRPTQHEKFGLEREPGLTNVLIGRVSIDDALRDTGIPRLKLLTCGDIPPNPAELLGSHTMRRVADMLQERADLVIYDSPPVLAAADTQGLASQVDGVLYVAHMGLVEKSAVRSAAELLKRARARVLGVVFNKVEVSAKGAYGYGYGYGYRYSQYSSYRNYYSHSHSTDIAPSNHANDLAAEFEALPLQELNGNLAVTVEVEREAHSNGTKDA